jgi:hypothetical protein
MYLVIEFFFNSNSPSLHTAMTGHVATRLQLDHFEDFFYRMAYALHQHALQFNEQLAVVGVRWPLAKGPGAPQSVVVNAPVELVALNLDEDFGRDMDVVGGSGAQQIAFNSVADEFYSQVFFVNASLVVGLSEAQKEISIWQVDCGAKRQG